MACMSHTLTRLKHALAHDVAADTACADALFAMADEVGAAEYAGFARTFRTVARMHRAKAIELRARLDAMGAEPIDLDDGRSDPGLP